MCERGITVNCRNFEYQLAETFQSFATRTGVSTVTLRKYFRGDAPIRRSTFNQISRMLANEYEIEVDPEKHFFPKR